MKLHLEDPRLTAYVLGELSVADAAAVERAVAADPALMNEVNAMRGIQNFLTEKLTLPAAQLPSRHRDVIRRAAREVEHAGKVNTLARLAELLKTLIIPTCAAAVLALTTYILLRMPTGEKNTVAEKQKENAPSPIKVPPPAAETKIPAPAPVILPSMRQGSLAAGEFPTLDLPVQFGKSNLESISNSIRNDHQLPPHNTVRLEEILNGFPLRLNGTAAIARSATNTWHPDNRDSGMSAHVATLSTELIACPWKPSATLLLISLKGNAQSDSEVKLAFHVNPEYVSRYRFLGFTPGEGHSVGNLSSHFPAKSSITLALEIESSQPGGDFGSLVWSTDGKPAPSIFLIHKSDVEPSDDARFAALVCAYALWLSGEQTDGIDSDIVSALAREVATATLPTDRADFLSLIDKSLHL